MQNSEVPDLSVPKPVLRFNRFSSAGPSRPRFRFGLLTQALLSKESADCDLSPNSIRNFMNPLRSQLGLEPITAQVSTSVSQDEEVKPINPVLKREDLEKPKLADPPNENFQSIIRTITDSDSDPKMAQRPFVDPKPVNSDTHSIETPWSNNSNLNQEVYHNFIMSQLKTKPGLKPIPPQVPKSQEEVIPVPINPVNQRDWKKSSDPPKVSFVKSSQPTDLFQSGLNIRTHSDIEPKMNQRTSAVDAKSVDLGSIHPFEIPWSNSNLNQELSHTNIVNQLKTKRGQGLKPKKRLPLPSSIATNRQDPFDPGSTHTIETHNSNLNLTQEFSNMKMNSVNQQNIEPKSGGHSQGIGVACVISQKQLSRSVSGLAINPAECLGNKINNHSTGPLRIQNNIDPPRTPVIGLGPPPPPHMPSSKKKSFKKASGSGWKFSKEIVSGKEYLILKELGKGGCGQVYLVMEKESTRFFAMKKVHLAGLDQGNIQECINEVTMLIELKDSELVIQIDSWEMSQTDNTIKIIMEYGHCDLNKSMQSMQSRLSLSKVKFIWERLLQIVEVIHSRGIVHADLKPANFVWVGENLKLIDFGISNRLQTDHTSISMINPKGTLNFISPETIRPDAMGRAKIGPKSDIWSLGCILYMMVYGKTPFHDITHQVSKMNAILTGVIDYPPLPEQLKSSSVTSVLKLCFELDSKKRPTATELLKHSFFFESSFRM